MRPALVTVTALLLLAAVASAASTPPRLFSKQSPWNTPLPARVKIDPNSGQMVAHLLAAGRAKGFAVAHRTWTRSVYFSSAKTPRVRVTFTAPWRGAEALAGVPIPVGAKPDPSEDGHLAVIDRAEGCEYDFFGARRTNGRWLAEWGNSIRLDSTGVYGPRGSAANASGFALTAGLIFPAELQAGVIRHALFFAYPYTRSGGPVPPAPTSDGRTNATWAIPEGARLQLDPALDLSRFKLQPWQLVIARALQRYGMILGDTGGAVSLYARNENSTNYRYPFDGNYGYLPTELLAYMRVLKLPPQTAQNYGYSPSGCGTWIER